MWSLFSDKESNGTIVRITRRINVIISSNVNVLSDVFQAWNFIILKNYFRKSEKFNLQLLIYFLLMQGLIKWFSRETVSQCTENNLPSPRKIIYVIVKREREIISDCRTFKYDSPPSFEEGINSDQPSPNNSTPRLFHSFGIYERVSFH